MADTRLQVLIDLKDSLSKNLEKMGKNVSTFGDKMKSMGEKATGMGKKLTATVTLPILALGTASFNMAADMQDAMGAVDQVFKDSGESVKNWANDMPSYYGIAEGEALQYATTMGSMLKNIGKLTDEQAAEQSETLLKLAGDLTAMYGGDVQDAVRALTGSLKGNNTMLDNYGMAVTDAMLKQRAFDMGLMDLGGTMDLQTKQAATLSLIMEQSSAAQGQAAREAEGASGATRAFATEIKNLAADIGSILLPIVTPMIAYARDLASKFRDLSPETQKVILVVGGLAAAMGPLLLLIGALVPGITAVGGALTFLAANPIVLIIGAVVALVAGLVALVKNWDWVKEKATGAIQTIRNFAEEHFNWLLTFFDGFFIFLKETFLLGWDFINILSFGLLGKLFDWIVNNFDAVKAGIGVTLSVIGGFFKLHWGAIKTVVTPIIWGITTGIEGIGKMLKVTGAALKVARVIFKHFADAIKDYVQPILDAIGRTIGFVAEKVASLVNKLRSLGKEQGGGGGNIAGKQATGGFVQAGSSYIVGEKGQELFTPNQSGYIIPNNEVSGGGGVTLVMNGAVNGDDAMDAFMSKFVDTLKLHNAIT